MKRKTEIGEYLAKKKKKSHETFHTEEMKLLQQQTLSLAINLPTVSAIVARNFG